MLIIVKRLILKFILILFLLTSFMDLATTAYAAGPKRIDIDLSAQRLYAYEGDTRVFNIPISSGRTATPTPTGTFYPQVKLRYDEMIGGSRAQGTYYDLPNVPYVVYFSGSYAIHGTYWHNNFGYPMSHGCVNLPTGAMSALYPWMDSSTRINIYGVTPAS